MPQLLIEFQTEEIPARMQARAEADLERLLNERLLAAGFMPEGVKALCGPRRLTAVVEGLPARQPDVREERKGPRVGAPEAAVQGFLRGAGLTSIAQAQVVEDKKGAFYVATIEKKGRETADVIAEIVPDVARAFPWPKSMRSQDQDFQWVRPLRRLVVAFDGEVVPCAVGGIQAGRETEGHRFHGKGPFSVRRFDDYVAKLRENFVLLDRDERKAKILADARTLAQARNLELVEDPGLLEEVAGLAEWPVVLMGDMDPTFLDLPGEVIRLTMRTHQKYFAVRDPKTGRLAPHFVIVANIEAKDGGRAIAAGNARVLTARLSDARFFWDADLRTPLDDEARRRKLEQLVFHAKLGSVWNKVERVAALARELAPACGADPDLAEQAARLAKMDLATETVGEFPELQGQIGRLIYLAQQGERANPSIAAAIEDHYRPVGPSDRVPTDPVAAAVALADKLDTLTGFWAIDEKPTGSSDPYALRRAALGVVRIVLERGVRFDKAIKQPTLMALAKPMARAKSAAARFMTLEPAAATIAALPRALDSVKDTLFDQYAAAIRDEALTEPALDAALRTAKDLVAFLADRLKVQLREQGKRHDLVDAVFALGDDDLVRIVARVEALSAFLASEDGKNLLAGYRRAANILAAEEKKGKGLSEAEIAAGVDQAALKEPAEQALAAALAPARETAQQAVEAERFADAMAALSKLRGPVDSFFEQVLVNSDDLNLRRNRMLLLMQFRDALAAVADFSKIEG